MAVHIEKDGPVTTIILSRPEVRNAVDRDTAQELADAFRRFEADNDRMSAIEQFNMTFEDAMANEFKRGLASLKTESVAGAKRFAKGAGRHGDFKSSFPEVSEIK